MAYIYKITNQINQKCYIGKTLRTIEVRWREHRKDYQKPEKSHQPLYRAMNKYGFDNFAISIVEECDDTIVEERERYWIEYYQSFKNGYNATLGGDGKPYIDYDKVCALYEIYKNQNEVARQMNINKTTVHYILRQRNIDMIPSSLVTPMTTGKVVHQYSLNNDYINTFMSLSEAARYLKDEYNITANISSIVCNIGRCLSGKRKTAYKFIWK